MAMIKCEFCKSMVSDSESKCPRCGHSVSNKVACPKCGSKNTEFSTKLNGLMLFWGIFIAVVGVVLIAILDVYVFKSPAVKVILFAVVSGISGFVATRGRVRWFCKDCGRYFKQKTNKK